MGVLLFSCKNYTEMLLNDLYSCNCSIIFGLSLFYIIIVIIIIIIIIIIIVFSILKQTKIACQSSIKI